MNFRNQENGENLAFSLTFQFHPILDNYKIRTRANFENLNGKRSTSNNLIHTKRIVPGLKKFYSGHFQNTPNIKTFFGLCCYRDQKVQQK